MRNVRLAMCAIAASALAACEHSAGKTNGGTLAEAQPNGAAGLMVLDSIQLTMPDSVALSMPSALALAGTGELFVADAAAKRVLHFSPSGVLIRAIGRRGAGPGELQSAGTLALLGDTVLLVKDVAQRRIAAYDLRPSVSAHAGTQMALPGWPIPARWNDLVVANGELSGALVDPTGVTSVNRLTMRDSSVSAFGMVPPRLSQHPMLIGPFGTVVHARRGTATITAFEVSNQLYIESTGAPPDSIVLPTLRRRGAQEALLDAVVTDSTRGMDAIYKSSFPWTMDFVNDSVVAVTHGDMDFDRGTFTGRFYLSLLDIRRFRVCIDQPIDAPAEPMPRFAMRGDTLMAVVVHVGDATRPVSSTKDTSSADHGPSDGVFLKRWRVNLLGCPWNYVQRR